LPRTFDISQEAGRKSHAANICGADYSTAEIRRYDLMKIKCLVAESK
jgi:hypothetical protein